MPHFFYIGSPDVVVPPLYDYWQAHDGSLNSDTVEILPTGSGAPVVGNNNKTFLQKTSSGAVVKAGSWLYLINSSLGVADDFDLDTLIGVSNQVNVVSFLERGGSYWLTVAANDASLPRGMDFRHFEFTFGGSINLIQSTGRLWLDALNSGTANVTLIEEVVINNTGSGAVFIYYNGNMSGGVVIDDYFSANPIPRTSGGGTNLITGYFTSPRSILNTGSNRGYYKFLESPSPNEMFVAELGTTVPLPGSDVVQVYLCERQDDVYSGAPAGVSAMEAIGGYLELQSYLLPNGGASGDGDDIVACDFMKLDTNLYLGVSRIGAVLFSMDSGTGGGTVIDSIAFPVDIQGSPASMSTTGTVKPDAALETIQPLSETFIEVVIQFDKGDATGTIPFRYFNVTLRLNDLGGGSFEFDSYVNGPIQTDQNVSIGPAFSDYWQVNFAEDEIWNIWPVTGGGNVGLNGIKIIR